MAGKNEKNTDADMSMRDDGMQRDTTGTNGQESGGNMRNDPGRTSDEDM